MQIRTYIGVSHSGRERLFPVPSGQGTSLLGVPGWGA